MADKAAIHTEGLTKHYGDVRALVDLDLDVYAGEVFGFLGPNGAGKTTMIRTILDEIRPTSGSSSILKCYSKIQATGGTSKPGGQREIQGAMVISNPGDMFGPTQRCMLESTLRRRHDFRRRNSLGLNYRMNRGARDLPPGPSTSLQQCDFGHGLRAIAPLESRKVCTGPEHCPTIVAPVPRNRLRSPAEFTAEQCSHPSAAHVEHLQHDIRSARQFELELGPRVEWIRSSAQAAIDHQDVGDRG